MKVAPFTGAWIEIVHSAIAKTLASVAPFTGAWIEIKRHTEKNLSVYGVAPFTGAWIEIQ